MKTKLTKVLSLLFVAVMMLSILPASVFAKANGASDVDTNGEAYCVMFIADGKCVSMQMVDKYHNASCPAAPYKHGYVFMGWSSNWRNVTSHRTVNGYYKYIGLPNGYLNNVELG